jgi:ketol-acid reductoisomerase
MKNETIAIIGYGVQGPAQALNLRDNGFNVIVGQRKGSKTWDKAVSHGWVPGETLFDIEASCETGNCYSVSFIGCRSDCACGQPSNHT